MVVMEGDRQGQGGWYEGAAGAGAEPRHGAPPPLRGARPRHHPPGLQVSCPH